MKGDQIGALTAHPSLQELSLSNSTWFRKRVRAKVVQLEGTTQRIPVPIDKPHREWAEALREALGTTSNHFVDASLRRLMAATMLPGEAVPTTNSLSAALALIEGMAPENEVQAAL